MTNFPALLKQRRKDLGISLDKAASQIKIRKTYLRAIENGHFADIPFSVYTIGYLRNYAKLLHLNSEELVNQFQSSFHGLDKTETALYYSQENIENSPSWPLIIGSLITGLWLYQIFTSPPISYLDIIPQKNIIEFIETIPIPHDFIRHRWLIPQGLEFVIVAKADISLTVSYHKSMPSKNYALLKGAIIFIPFNGQISITTSNIISDCDILLNETR